MKFYRKKPEVIAAVQYKEENKEEVLKFVKPSNVALKFRGLKSGDGITDLHIQPGEFVIKYSSGSYEIFGKEEFNKNFERV